jgi:hypothetical protein
MASLKKSYAVGGCLSHGLVKPFALQWSARGPGVRATTQSLLLCYKPPQICGFLWPKFCCRQHARKDTPAFAPSNFLGE